MSTTRSREEQIVLAHAGLIHRVVLAVHDPARVPDLDDVLRTAERNGWSSLVQAIRDILAGKQEAAVQRPLDEEDAVIVEAILRGLRDPKCLPGPDQSADASQAAPGLAGMIYAAQRGDHQALTALSQMAEQMSKAGGDMARLGAVMRRLVNGETEVDALTKGMGPLGRGLVVSILDHLALRRTH